MSAPLLAAHDVVRIIGYRTILDGVSLTVDDSTRVALVGRNGSGKSTLLRVPAGIDEPDGGRVVRAHGIEVLHLPQLDAADDAVTVRARLHLRLGVAGAAPDLPRCPRSRSGTGFVASRSSCGDEESDRLVTFAQARWHVRPAAG
jgi:ABC-type Mn2+/Zn2+ transport system ATPase subunit